MKTLSPERRFFLFGPWCEGATAPANRRTWLKYRFTLRFRIGVLLLIGTMVVAVIERLAPHA